MNDQELVQAMQQLHVRSRSYVCCINWFTERENPLSILHRASCGALQIGENLFGVTAAHVVRKYQADAADQTVYGALLDEEFDLNIIDINDDKDIATFEIPAALLETLQKTPIIYPANEWPPVSPVQEQGVLMSGYPADRQRLGDDGIAFEMVTNRLIIDNLTPHQTTINVVPDVLMDEAPFINDIAGEIGGYSGTPLLLERMGNTQEREFDFGGIIIEGHKIPQENPERVRLIVSPPDLLNADGTIVNNQPNI